MSRDSSTNLTLPRATSDLIGQVADAEGRTKSAVMERAALEYAAASREYRAAKARKARITAAREKIDGI